MNVKLKVEIMKEFKVVLKKTVYPSYYVEATNKKDAEKLAFEMALEEYDYNEVDMYEVIENKETSHADKFIIPPNLNWKEGFLSLSFNEMVDYCKEHLCEDEVYRLCDYLEDTHGTSFIYELGNKLGYKYAYCKPCEADTPSADYFEDKCLVCGSHREKEVSHA